MWRLDRYWVAQGHKFTYKCTHKIHSNSSQPNLLQHKDIQDQDACQDNFSCSHPPQYPLIQQLPGEQADADRGGPGSDRCRGHRGGRSPTGGGQRRGRSHLQLFLLPLQPLPGLPLHHDDPHQLVQVSIWYLLFLANSLMQGRLSCNTDFSPTLFLAHQAQHRLPGHAELHAGCMGEDRLQLARPGHLPLDPGGPAGAPRERLQLKTVKSICMWSLASCYLHLKGK